MDSRGRYEAVMWVFSRAARVFPGRHFFHHQAHSKLSMTWHSGSWTWHQVGALSMGSHFKCSTVVIPFRCSFLGALQNFLRSRVFPRLDAALRASTPEMSIDHRCIVSSSSEKSLVRAGTHRIFPCRLLSTASSQHFHDFNVLYPGSAIEVAW